MSRTSTFESTALERSHGDIGGARVVKSNGARRKPLRASTQPQRWSRRTLIIGALAAAVILTVAGFAWSRRGWRDFGASDRSLVFYTVTRADLPITVTERGNLESQQNTEVRCEIETVSGQYGTRIVWIVPNGKAVSEGELLVDFDAAPLQERLDSQVVVYEQAKAAQIQAAARFGNQQAQNDTALAAAKLKVELAELNLKMYEDGADGTYQLSRQDLDLKIQEAKNQIVEAQAALLLQVTSRNGMDMLYKLGYRGKGDRDQSEYRVVQAEDVLVKATNSLSNAASNRKKLEQFEYPMKKLELKGTLTTAQQSKLQVERDNTSLLAQSEAAKNAAERQLKKEKERLDKYGKQLEKCKIHAPHDGMVAYSPERTPWGRPVGEGELVVERFKILTLPDLSTMQVKMMVHESVLDQVRDGLPATVQLDAFPDHVYHATVRSVGVLPSQGGSYQSADVKVYETIVTIDEKVEQLKPGMTAVVDVHVDRLKDVLSVPVQAVVQIEHESFCYIEGLDGVERKPVTLGRTNDKFVEITDGLGEGDRVVLNPMTIIDNAENKVRTISPEM